MIDLIAPVSPVRKASNAEQQLRGIAANLGVPEDDPDIDYIKAAIRQSTPIGHPFFDAEEDIFVERFGITNFEPSVRLGPLYLPDEAQGIFHGAIRITNLSEFPISSLAPYGVIIGYHWLKDGAVLAGEGARSQLPLPVEPGQSVTAPFVAHAPQEPGRYQLRVSVLQEHLRWYFDESVTGSIDVTAAPIAAHASLANGTAFTEAIDTDLASEFIANNLDLRPESLALEIGGGIRPSFRTSHAGATWPGAIINCDVSRRLLLVARMIALKNGHNFDVQVRGDANKLPISSNSVGAVFISRALHHFANLHVVLREVARVLEDNGQLFLLSEPVGVEYDAFTRDLISRNVNEQVFPLGIYERCAREAGFNLISAQNDWGFSFKGMFRKIP